MANQQNVTLVSASDDRPVAATETNAPSRQQVVEELLGRAGTHGMTWKEFDTAAGWNHHGRSTAALSALHKSGRLARLTEQRNKCSVYVLVEHVAGREVSPHGPRNSAKVSTGEVARLRERNDTLFAALDNLSHAAAFRKHRHVWVDEAKTCFLCVAREVVDAERALRGVEAADGAGPKERAATAAGAVLSGSAIAS